MVFSGRSMSAIMNLFRMKPKSFRLTVCAIAFLALLSGPSGSDGATAPQSGTVVFVFDGDTVLLDSGQKVRYLGIDSPEVEHKGAPLDCYGSEAKQENVNAVLGKKVRLEYDSHISDSHGRLLAYVFLPDGKCLNEELVKSGYAWVFRSRDSFRMFNAFLEKQREAIQGRRGMWAACRKDTSDFYLGNRQSYIFHLPRCPFGRETSPRNRTRFQTRLAAFEEGYSPCRRCKP